MVMAVRVFHLAGLLTVAAGYESGHTALFRRNSRDGEWETFYASQPHTQPVLSLDLSPPYQCYFTSSADAIIAKHPLPAMPGAKYEARPLQLTQTKHSGQQGLDVRSDGKILATAGWDGRVRIYASRTTTEMAVLKWHKEGCYAVAFAKLDLIDSESSTKGEPKAVKKAQLVTAQTAQQHSGSVAREREERAEKTHWLAVGSKDGKVSLWDIY
ncbi:MAG: ASTRA complex subunit [Candelina submexicana]|nr:MAG: ASTRA complex subunit [Candelina submexicana]